MCVELMDNELNSGCFIVSSDVISFIVILMYTFSSLNIPVVPWWIKCQVKIDLFKGSDPPVNGTVYPSSFIVDVSYN